MGVNEGEELLVDEETFAGDSFARDDERLAWVYTDVCESTDVFLSSIVPLPRCESILGRESMLGRESGMGGRTASTLAEEGCPCEDENLDILLAIENLEYR